MTVLRVVTMSAERVAEYRPAPGDICISITSDANRPAQLAYGFADVLRLTFIDDPFPNPNRPPQGIQPVHADGIAALIAKHIDQPVTCVVHCMVGTSRSPAIALALEDAGLVRYERPWWWTRLAEEEHRAHITLSAVYREVTEAVHRYGEQHDLMWPVMEEIARRQRGAE
jgi:hypothetical protein